MTFAAHIPVLTTDRLTLRAPQRSDFDAYAGIVTSDRAQYMNGAESRADAWSGFFADCGSWIVDDFGYWTIADRTTDAPRGFVGIAHYAAFPEVELGWMVTHDSEGQGYAFEAASAALAWGFGTRNLPTLVSYIDQDNARSIALAQRLRAAPDPDAARPDPEDIVFRHKRPAQ